ncbi:MAG: 50S ribosomal protein L34 [Candidatus Levybacteria bacterium CG10_big_fil_rev_8_21_14_0_10_36_7]|nr:MAG: 50S ribosomal protein L34 [Candidatus Levybacteria bacterium CG10_big_fil_rev_8_21_14_0_10_36_7]
MPEILTKHKKTKGKKKHGFLTRLKSKSGKRTIKRRILKGRKKI